ncbi:MAG: NAD-dependent epimerase/dehydratase family protein [Pseudomonadota bacterium]
MTKCFITGGAGFIGSHLVEACLARGDSVIVLDDLSTGKKGNLPPGNPGLKFIQGDITDRQKLLDIRKNNPDIEYIFHLAALVSVPKAMADPLHAHKVNFDGTLLLLDTFKSLALKKFIFASSSAVYGDTKIIPVREDFLPRPISTYGADKLQGEHYLKIYNDAFNLPTASCRFFNVFGERQDPSSLYSGVISIFLDKSLAQKKGLDTAMTIYGDGQQTRDFIYVKDIVGALLCIAGNQHLRGTELNLGYGQQTTIVELARKIMHLAGVDLKLDFQEQRPGDIKHSVADIKKLLNTGFTFRHSFDEGLKNLAAFS